MMKLFAKKIKVLKVANIYRVRKNGSLKWVCTCNEKHIQETLAIYAKIDNKNQYVVK